MLLPFVAALLLFVPPAALRADTAIALPPSPLTPALPLSLLRPDSAVADSVRRRRVVVEYSDWYARRLSLHRWASYTMLPLFAAQYVAGEQLFAKGSDAPLWARRAHGPMAAGVATLFTVNTATGLWNLWDSRQDPAGRGPRLAHSLLMIASDAGFTAAGLIADRASSSGDLRQRHRAIALGSMGAALLGYAIMLPPLRRD